MTWPVLHHYDQDHLARIALPLGGIGTGTLSLGGRGDLRDWELMNRPAKGFIPGRDTRTPPSFTLYARAEGGDGVARLLEGPLDYYEYEGASGSPAANHGLPRFARCAFDAAYPFGRVHLSDDAVPVDVRLEAFNPLIPCDADRSGLPVAVLRYVLTNRTGVPVTAAVCGSMPNFIGMDGTDGACGENRNRYRAGDGYRGLFMTSKGVDRQAAQWGTMALVNDGGYRQLPDRLAGRPVGHAAPGLLGRVQRRRHAYGPGCRWQRPAHGLPVGPDRPGGWGNGERDLRAGLAFSQPVYLDADTEGGPDGGRRHGDRRRRRLLRGRRGPCDEECGNGAAECCEDNGERRGGLLRC